MKKFKNIDKFLDFVFNDKTNENAVLELKKVRQKEADFVKTFTGLSVYEYTHTIDKYAVLHIMKKHGTDKEYLRGQIPVSKDDFKKAKEMIENGEMVYQGYNKLNNPAFLYVFTDENVNYYIEEIRTGRKTLALTTFYKREKKE